MQDIRWQQRFEKYKQALHQLESAVIEYADTEIDIIKEGIIQFFDLSIYHKLTYQPFIEHIDRVGKLFYQREDK